ncbi:MAG: Ig-like domain-containing protein [Bacteroidales bacterium]|jgi:uncharacterized protein YjdB|nr:Ig-like domain-containing protein [Bacteroidales bacterium]
MFSGRKGFPFHMVKAAVLLTAVLSLSQGCVKTIEVSAVSIDRPSVELAVSGTVTLTATVLPVDASNPAVYWSSSDTDVATVESGFVTAVAPGEATVTVTTVDGAYTAKCNVTVTDPAVKVNKVSFDVTDSVLVVGDSFVLAATVLPEDAADKSLTWKSNDERIAGISVSDDGFSAEVTAVKAGTAKVTATSVNGYWANCSLTVEDAEVPVESVSVKPTTMTICIGQTSNVSATVSPSNATDKGVSWSCSDPLLAVVDDDGNVTGVAEGTCTVTATTEGTSSDGGNQTASCEVTVSGYASVKSISLSDNSLTMNIGDTDTLLVSISPSYAHDKSVTCASSDEGVVQVSMSGTAKVLAKALKAGESTITVTANDGSGKSAGCSAEVLKDTVDVTGVSFDVRDTVLNFTSPMSDSLLLNVNVYPEDATVKDLLWISGNAGIAYVRQNGMVIGMGEGDTYIAAMSVDNSLCRDTCWISVRRDTVYLKSISIAAEPGSDTESRLYSGQTVRLSASIDPANANYMTGLNWSSGDGEVTVSASSSNDVEATATVVNAGNLSSSSEVKVESENGVDATSEVYFGRIAIFGDYGEITDTLEMETDDMCAVSCEWNESVASFSKVPDSDVDWSISDRSVAYYSGGCVYGSSSGVTSLTAVVGFTSVSIPVKIIEKSLKVKGISVDPSAAYMVVGDSLQLKATITPQYAENRNVTWSSSDEEVAMVDTAGLVRGISKGKSTVDAVTEDGGFTASCTVTVSDSVVHVTGISMVFDTVSVQEGGNTTLRTIVSPINATYKSLTWSTDKPDVVAVSSEGTDDYGQPDATITGLAEGDATVTAVTLDGGYSASSHVVVEVKSNPVTSVSVSADPETGTEDRLYPGQTVRLEASYKPDDANCGTDITWTSSDESMVSVVPDAIGSLTASATVANPSNKTGVAVIAAMSSNGVADYSTVYVGEIAVGRDGERMNFLSAKGNTEMQLQCLWEISNGTMSEVPLSAVTWTTSDPSVATISSSGLLKTLKSNSTVTVTAKVGAASASASVDIGDEYVGVTGVELSQTSIEAVKDSVFSLSAIVYPPNADNTGVKWSSSDESVATVGDDGTVTVNESLGSTDITVTTDEGGFTASCIVSVSDKVMKITLINDATAENRSYSGQTVKITPVFYPDYATEGTNLMWSGSNGSYGTVDQKGNVTITASMNYSSFLNVSVLNGNGLAASTMVYFGKLHLLCNGDEVSAVMSAYKMEVGNEVQLSVTYETDSAGDQSPVSAVTWDAPVPGVLKVDDNGKVTAVAKSTNAKITATVGNIVLTFYASISEN